jgi:hypothetical protein
MLWVSSSSELRGDPFLGPDANKRFLPSRFDVQGFAIDAVGGRCESLACPKCHLIVPRILCETWPLFISILGAPSSGKSYFLASAIWQLRQRLGDFNVDFTDSDPVANQVVSSYEQKLFLNDSPNDLVSVNKTQTQGELYQHVRFSSEREEWFAKPFIFTMRPDENNAYGATKKKVAVHSRALCLYDNAGEHFLPNADADQSPATTHLALSKSLLFVFDPVQHPKFRGLSRGHSEDPQLSSEFKKTNRQDEILQEAAKRIRRKANLAESEKFEKPLVVVVNKYDVWRKLIPSMDLDKISPYTRSGGKTYLNSTVIKQVSNRVEKLLKTISPEVVSVCKSFCKDITYIPVSPIGGSPEVADSDLLGVRPKNIRPIWAEVPLLYAMSRSKCKLVPRATTKPSTRSKSRAESPSRK